MADGDVHLTPVETDREVLRHRLRKAELLRLFGVLELGSECHRAKAVSFFCRSRFLLLGSLGIVSSPDMRG
jgi:hypothetical protein